MPSRISLKRVLPFKNFQYYSYPIIHQSLYFDILILFEILPRIISVLSDDLNSTKLVWSNCTIIRKVIEISTVHVSTIVKNIIIYFNVYV